MRPLLVVATQLPDYRSAVQELKLAAVKLGLTLRLADAADLAEALGLDEATINVAWEALLNLAHCEDEAESLEYAANRVREAKEARDAHMADSR